MSKRLFTACSWLVALSFLSTAAFAQERSLDERINDALSPVADAFAGMIFTSVRVAGADLPLILVWLVAAAVIFTIYMGFINIRGFALAVRVTRGDYDDPEDKGEVSHFQALTAALSGTVGLGNIAGVAVAIGIGGPGATFWMIVAGLLSMTTKFVECTLAVRYRKIDAAGEVSGGPMYYLRYGLAEKNLPRLGNFLAITFAVLCVGGSLGGGNMFQVNQAYQQVYSVTGGADGLLAGRGWLFGMAMAGLVALVIIGGIKSIARVTSVLVPVMCAIYVGAAIFILLSQYHQIPAAFLSIFHGAFSPEGIQGGVVGVLIQGFRRAAFSNEAGIGSAPIAHAAARTKEPITEGFTALLEPFIDTVVVCTATALVIVISGAYASGLTDGVSMTSAAFATVFDWFPVLLSAVVAVFAFSTQVTWSYYGLKAWTFLVGELRAMALGYKMVFLSATVVGASMDLGAVIDFSDGMMFAMAIPNLIGLYLMAPVVKTELKNFLRKVEAYHAGESGALDASAAEAVKVARVTSDGDRR